MNSLTVLNGNVVVNTENKNLKVKNIENIESWTFVILQRSHYKDILC